MRIPYLYEGAVIPSIRVGKLEIGGGIFKPFLFGCGVRFIRKYKSSGIDALYDPVQLEIYSSVGIKTKWFGVYIKWIHRKGIS